MIALDGRKSGLNATSFESKCILVGIHIYTNKEREYIKESMGAEEAEKAASGGIAQREKISRSTLEKQAGESTIPGHSTPEERFWQRQQGQGEAIATGRGYISKVNAFQSILELQLTHV